MPHRKSRVTIDIDHYEPNYRLTAVRAYHNLRALPDCFEVEVTISSSGRGLHLVGWFDTFLDEDDKLDLRAALGDDIGRVRMDEVRDQPGHVTQVLWTNKGSRQGTADDDFETIWDALDHINMSTRSDYDRVHNIANYGHKSMIEHRGVTSLKRASGLDAD